LKGQTIGVQFHNYQQYCDVVDEALASIQSPLINDLPMTAKARRLITEKRLFYVKGSDSVLLFLTHDHYDEMFYIAGQYAVCTIPNTDIPIVVYRAWPVSKPDPRHDALLKRVGFTLDRVNIGMEFNLDKKLNREAYIHGMMPETITDGLAMPGELDQIGSLLLTAFDPVQDELPSRNELLRMIRDGDVFVIRDGEIIAAVTIRIPRGATAVMHWIAVDEKYRKLKLTGKIAFVADTDSQKRGYRQIVIWVDERAVGWRQSIEKRGYHLTQQRLNIYTRYPQGAE
jgi:hypothetical protein